MTCVLINYAYIADIGLLHINQQFVKFLKPGTVIKPGDKVSFDLRTKSALNSVPNLLNAMYGNVPCQNLCQSQLYTEHNTER